ncbi:hypothetical protein ACS0TY_030465 [Phlomoides rotata]
MAVSKLNYLFSCHLQFQTPHFPTKNCRSPQLPLLSFKNPSPPSLKIQLFIPNFQPKCPVKTTIKEEERESPYHNRLQNPSSLSVLSPSLAFSNTLFFNSPYNVQVIVSENEPEEALIHRFRREVLRAGVLQECKRRQFFEDTREKRKRKTREAARRYRKRRPPPNASKQVKAPDSTSKKKKQDTDGDDNWEFLDIDLPYC